MSDFNDWKYRGKVTLNQQAATISVAHHVASLTALAKAITPQQFIEITCGILGNVAGDMPQEYFDRMSDGLLAPCNDPECSKPCTCRDTAMSVYAAFVVLRDEYIKTLEARKAKAAQEGGFAE